MTDPVRREIHFGKVVDPDWTRTINEFQWYLVKRAIVESEHKRVRSMAMRLERRVLIWVGGAIASAGETVR